MPTNNFVPVAAAAGSNVTSDAAWNGSSFQSTGVLKGIVPSAGMNKAWRQGTMAASALGQIIVDHGLIDAVDDGNVTGLKANLRMAFAAMLAGTAFAVDGSATPNLLTVILDPAPPTLSTYRGIFVRVANTNTGPVTLTLNNLGTKPVVRKNGLPLVAGDIAQGQFFHLLYDLVAGQWVIAGSVASDLIAATQAAKSIFNVKQFQSNTRVSASGSVANQQSVVWSSVTYTKKSPTSLVLCWGCFQTSINFTPSGNTGPYGAAQIVLTLGGASQTFGIANSYPGFSYFNNFCQVFPNMGSGGLAISIGLQRPDSNPWTNVFNPTSGGDSNGTFPAMNVATLIFAEVEP